MLTKQQAAAYLNINGKPRSERSIERYVKEGKLNVTYNKEPGKAHDTPYFNEEELEALKKEMESPKQIAPKPVRSETALLAPGNAEALQLLTSAISQHVAQAIAQVATQRTRPSLSTITGKLTLTREELIARTGLPWTVLLKAIKAKELRGKKVGEGKKGNGGRWNFKSDDVDAFIDAR